MSRYHLIVVGAGAAGLAAATFAAQLGVRVALVEADRIGGDCTWTGCVPSKTLLTAARLAEDMRGATTFGLPAINPQVDLGQVMAQVRETVQRVSQFESPEVLARQGIEVVFGSARFLDPYRLDVDGRTFQSRHFVLATGARPLIPPIPGLAEVPHFTHQTIFTLQELPRRLLVLGAGPAGVELGQAFQRLGSAVTLLERAGRVLPAADPDASAVLATQLTEEGMRLRLGATVERIESRDNHIALSVAGNVCCGDALLVATGRRPNVDGMGLERAGVVHSAERVAVDEYLRTSQRHIYAAGDVTGAPQFTHHAAWQGFVAARNALLPRVSRGTRVVVPWTVFTSPEISQVGLSEHEARLRGERVRVQRWPIERIDRAQTVGEQAGFLKLVSRPDGRLVGATVVARQAGELINELAVALEHQLTLGKLASTLHSYPTYSFAIQQASAEAAIDQLTKGWKGRLLRLLARWP